MLKEYFNNRINEKTIELSDTILKRLIPYKNKNENYLVFDVIQGSSVNNNEKLAPIKKQFNKLVSESKKDNTDLDIYLIDNINKVALKEYNNID